MILHKNVFLLLTLFASELNLSHAFIDGLYCGKENCYEVLAVNRDSTKGEITKAYRKLAKKWHPDMHKGKEAKDVAEKMFQKIANAYEILRDEQQRNDYNYMLDNPEEYYSHYFYYYRTRVSPKVDVRIVIGVLLVVISAVQYWGSWNNYNAAITYLVKDPKYRIRAMDLAKSDGLLTVKKRDRRSKEEIREEEEKILKKIIVEKMDIRGGYSRPKYTDIVLVRLVLLPYTLVMYIAWCVRWFWKFWVKQEEYGREEKLYLIKKYLKLGSTQWDAIEDYDKDTYLEKELWKKDKFDVWKKTQDEEMKAKLASSGRYKNYRRYMKKGGPGQMTFGPE